MDRDELRRPAKTIVTILSASPGPTQLTFLGCLLLTGFVCLFTFLSATGDIRFGAVSLVAMLVLTVTWSRLPDKDPFRPEALFALFAGLSYPWQIWLIATRTDKFTGFFPGLYATIENSSRAGVTLALLGIFGFGVGSIFLGKPRARNSCYSQSPGSSSTTALTRANMVIVLGVLLTIALVILSGGISAHLDTLSNRLEAGAGRAYLTYGPVIVTCGGVARLIIEDKWPPSIATYAALVCGTVGSLLTGSKVLLGFGAIMVLTVVHWNFKPVKILKLTLLGLSLIFSLQMYNIVFRDALPRRIPVSQSIRERGGFAGMLGTDFVANTFFGYQALMIGDHYYPAKQPFLGTYSIRATLSAPVPRAFYASKPDSIAAPFTKTFAPSFWKQGSSVPPTLFGEGFISFGSIGVLSYGTIYGLICGRVYRRRGEGPRAMYFAVLSAASMMHVIRGELLSTTVFLAITGLSGGVVLWRFSPPRSEGLKDLS